MIKELFLEKHIRIITAIYIFVMAFCVIIGLISKNKIVFSSDERINLIEDNEQVVIAQEISLNPGIYRVEVDFNMDTDLLYGGFIYVEDDTVRTRGLESTGGPMYQGKNNATAEFILKDTTKSLKLISTVYKDDCAIYGARVINTGKKWFIAAFKITILFLSVLTINIYIKRIIKGNISQEAIISSIVLAGVCFFMILPALYQDTISSGDDGYHKQRIEGIASAIRSFQIPVRIEPHWLQGYGYANAIFYCDLFLVIPAILRIIGFSVTDSYNAYLILVNASILLVSYFSFKKIYKKEYVALTLSIIYSTTILRFYRLICVGVIGEGTAIIFFPLVLLGIYEIFYKENSNISFRRDAHSFLALGLGMAGIIQCHILSTEMISGAIILICVLNITKLYKKRIITNLLLSMLTALTLSLWFIVPFIEYYLLEDVHVKHVYTRTIQEWGLYIPQLFRLFVDTMGDGDELSKGMYHCNASGLSFLIIIGLIAFFIIWITGCLRDKKDEYKFAKHSFVISMLFVLFSLKLFPWNYLQSGGGILEALISSIQYPVRFLEIASIFSIPAIAGVISFFEKTKEKRIKWVVFILTALSFVFSSVYYQDANMSTVGKYYIANAEGIGTGYIAGGEYKPEGTDENALVYNKFSSSDNVQISDYSSGFLRGTTHIVNKSNQNGYVEYPFLNYRGYKAYDGLGNKFDIIYGVNNVIRVIVPSNFVGDITVKYVSPWYWHGAEIVSLAGLVSIIGLFIRERKKENNSIIQSKGHEEIKAKVSHLSFIKVFFAVFTVIMTLNPYLTGYVINGKYINEILSPYKKISLHTGISAYVLYISLLLAMTIAAYNVIRAYVKRLSWMIGLKDAALELTASFVAMTYMLSPLSLYVLYRLFDPYAWITILMIPAIIIECAVIINRARKRIKILTVEDILTIIPISLIMIGILLSSPIKGYDELADSLSITKIFLSFPRNGTNVFGVFLSYPLGISFTILFSLIMVILISIYTGLNFSERKHVSKGLISMKISIISISIFLIGCIPQVLTVITNPQIHYSLLLLMLVFSEAIGVLSVPYLICYVKEKLENEVLRLIVFVLLGIVTLLPAVFHLNSIVYESFAVWL